MSTQVESALRKPRVKVSSRILSTDISSWIRKRAGSPFGAPIQNNMTRDEKQECVLRMIKDKKMSSQKLNRRGSSIKESGFKTISRNNNRTRILSSDNVSHYSSSKLSGMQILT